MRSTQPYLVSVCAVTLTVAAATGSGLARQRAGGRLPPCSPRVERAPREATAQGCWFKSPHGGWRILSHDAHYDSIVFHVGADDLEDARHVAAVIVGAEGKALGELMLYVYAEPVATSSRIRRVRWDRVRGYETLDFGGRAPAWIIDEAAADR